MVVRAKRSSNTARRRKHLSLNHALLSTYTGMLSPLGDTTKGTIDVTFRRNVEFVEAFWNSCRRRQNVEWSVGKRDTTTVKSVVPRELLGHGRCGTDRELSIAV